MTNSIKLNAVQANSGIVAHVLTTPTELSQLHISQSVAQRIGDKLGAEEVLAVVDLQPLTTAVASIKTETDSSYRLQAWRSVAAKFRFLLADEKADTLNLYFYPTVTKIEALAVIESVVLSHYQFLLYRTGSKARPHSLQQINIDGAGVTQADLDQLSGVCNAVCTARDLVNEPVNTLSATEFGKRAAQLGSDLGFKVKVMEKAEIEALGMGGLLGVNKGSVEPPVFMVMEYKPSTHKNEQPVVLVGKGVVYDTGGYNIKVGTGMNTMKCDMGGGAAVLGTLCALAATKANVHVIGLIPATDNRIDGKALVADDVITMMDGTTIEVQNTDAEGRLILADALHFANQYNPMLVIDLATLTGAAAAITGHYGMAMCGTDTERRDALKASGDHVYERIMDLPMWREYTDLIKSDIADMRNIGGPTGGVLTAGAFLKHFTNYPWLHLDIAGPAFMKEDADMRLKGGTGVGVRLLYHFLVNLK